MTFNTSLLFSTSLLFTPVCHCLQSWSASLLFTRLCHFLQSWSVSCSGGVGNLIQMPPSGSTIVSYSPPVITCTSETIRAETIAMANILGAVVSAASAVAAMQVCMMASSVWVACVC